MIWPFRTATATMIRATTATVARSMFTWGSRRVIIRQAVSAVMKAGRGWSPRAADFRGLATCAPFVYASVDELFFALVNLCAGPRGDA